MQTVVVLGILLVLCGAGVSGQLILSGPVGRPWPGDTVRITSRAPSLTAPITYSWACTMPTGCRVALAQTSVSLPHIVIPPSTLAPDTDYIFTLTAADASHTLSSSFSFRTGLAAPEGGSCAAVLDSAAAAGSAFSLPRLNVSCAGWSGSGSLTMDVVLAGPTVSQSAPLVLSLAPVPLPQSASVGLPPLAVNNGSLDYFVAARIYTDGLNPLFVPVNVTVPSVTGLPLLQAADALLNDAGATFDAVPLVGLHIAALNVRLAALSLALGSPAPLNATSAPPDITLRAARVFADYKAFVDGFVAAPSGTAPFTRSRYSLARTLATGSAIHSSISVYVSDSVQQTGLASLLDLASLASSLSVALLDSAVSDGIAAVRDTWSAASSPAPLGVPDARRAVPDALIAQGLSTLSELARASSANAVPGEITAVSLASSAALVPLSALYSVRVDCSNTQTGYGVAALCDEPAIRALDPTNGAPTVDVVSFQADSGWPLQASGVARRSAARPAPGARTLMGDANTGATRITSPCYAVVQDASGAAAAGSAPVSLTAIAGGHVGVVCDRSGVSGSVPRETLRVCASFEPLDGNEWRRGKSVYLASERLCAAAQFPVEVAVFDVPTDADFSYYLGFLLFLTLPCALMCAFVVWFMASKGRRSKKFYHRQLSELSYYSGDSNSHTTAHVPVIIPSDDGVGSYMQTKSISLSSTSPSSSSSSSSGSSFTSG